MIDPAQYLKTRVDDQIEWYGQKSSWNQKQYKRLRVASITISVIIPILTLLLNKEKGVNNTTIAILISVASAAVVLIQGILSLYKFHENWTQYRASAESLKYHKFLFETGTAPYNDANAFSTFVTNIETALATERISWVQGNKPDAGNKSGTAVTTGEEDDTEDTAKHPS